MPLSWDTTTHRGRISTRKKTVLCRSLPPEGLMDTETSQESVSPLFFTAYCPAGKPMRSVAAVALTPRRTEQRPPSFLDLGAMGAQESIRSSGLHQSRGCKRTRTPRPGAAGTHGGREGEDCSSNLHRTPVWKTGGCGAAKHGSETEYPKFTHSSVSHSAQFTSESAGNCAGAGGRGGYRGGAWAGLRPARGGTWRGVGTGQEVRDRGGASVGAEP